MACVPHLLRLDDMLLEVHDRLSLNIYSSLQVNDGLLCLRREIADDVQTCCELLRHHGSITNMLRYHENITTLLILRTLS